MAPEKTEALAVVERPLAVITPGALIQMALDRGTEIAQLERLLDLQIKWEANEARKAFVSAMTSFKADPPKIVKDHLVDYSPKTGGRVKFSHATLANIVREVTPALSKHELSAAWRTDQEAEGDRKITVSCTITHALGHSETITLSALPDQSGGKNAIQAVGSTVTYLQRYTLLAGLGLATEDMDDADQRKPEPVERPAMAPRATVDRLRAIATHDKAPEKIRSWLADRLLKAEKSGGLTADSAATILKGLHGKILALVPETDPDALPDWMGSDGDRPCDDREPGQEG